MRNLFFISIVSCLLFQPLAALKAQHKSMQKFSIGPEIGLGFSQMPNTSVNVNSYNDVATTERQIGLPNIVIGISTELKIRRKLSFISGIQYQKINNQLETTRSNNPTTTLEKLSISKIGVPIVLNASLSKKPSHFSALAGIRQNFILSGHYTPSYAGSNPYYPMNVKTAAEPLQNQLPQLLLGSAYQVKNGFRITAVANLGAVYYFSNIIENCLPTSYNNTDVNLTATYFLGKK